MTRINCGIPPKQLVDKHLIAEHHEIVRIPNAVKKQGKKLKMDLPETFRLGTGHVRFFYNKLKYLHNRYREIHQTCLERNFNVQNFDSAFQWIPEHLYNDYSPTTADAELVTNRINERFSKMKNARTTPSKYAPSWN